MILKLIAIAHNTFMEVIRQPVYLIVLFSGMGLIILSPYFTFFVLLSNIKLVKDTGLATIFITGLILGALSASNVIFKEIDKKTALLVISKPINRPTFILGKYLGIMVSIVVAHYLLTLVYLLVVRTEITEAAYSDSDLPVLLGNILAILLSFILAGFQNFFHEKPFASSTVGMAIPVFSIIFLALGFIDNKWGRQSFFANIDSQLILASILILLALAVLVAVSVAASTRLNEVMTITISIIIFFLGLFSSFLFGRSANDSLMAWILYNIIPDLQVYWIADAIIGERAVPWDYLIEVSGYTALFISGLMFLSMALFEERELG